MAYGLRTRAPVAGGQFEQERDRFPTEPWQQLSEPCRLALVERALTPRNLLPDALPAAL